MIAIFWFDLWNEALEFESVYRFDQGFPVIGRIAGDACLLRCTIKGLISPCMMATLKPASIRQNLPQVKIRLKDEVPQSHIRRKAGGSLYEFPFLDRRIDENIKIRTE